MWLQRDQGAGFVDVPNSNVEIILANNGEDVLSLAFVGYLAKDDKIRLMGSVNNTVVILDAINPVGEPAVPAVILAMYANSTGVNIQKEVLDIADASIAPPTTNVNDIYVLTNIGAIDPSWGSIANLEENDVVVYTGAGWEVSLDVSTQFTKGEYQVYNTADGKIYYYTGVEWIVLGSDTADVVPLWESNTNGGTYAINDLINYNGSLFKNLTGNNLDTTPNTDTTNWEGIIGLPEYESGEVVITTEYTSITAGADVWQSIETFQIPSAGRWRITGIVASDASADVVVTAGFRTGGVVVQNSEFQVGYAAASNRQSGVGIIEVETTGATTYELVAKRDTNVLANIYSGATHGFTKVRWEKVAGFLPLVMENAGVPTWKSNTNGGSYAINDLINYNGSLYKNLTGTNTDTTPNTDTTNWLLTTKNLGTTVTVNNAILFRHNWASVGFNLGVNSNNQDVFFTNNPSYRIIEPFTGANAGLLQIKSTQSGTAGEVREFATYPETTIVELNTDGDLEVAGDIKTATFSTAWLNSTNGGVYAINDLVIYSGGIYKNLTGNNSDTTPDLDTTNWEAVSGGGAYEYMVAKYSSSSFSISNGMTFPYNTVVESDGTSITSLGNGKFTLKAGGTYKLTADIGRFAGSGYVAWQWYQDNPTAALPTTSAAQQWGSNYNSGWTDSGTAHAMISPTVDTTVYLRQTSGTTTASQNTEGSYGQARVFIEKMK